MPLLNINEKMKCEECHKEYREADKARHERCVKVFFLSRLYLFYLQLTKLNYHVAKKHALSTSKQSTVCSSRETTNYSLQQHRQKEHGAKQGKLNVTLADLNKNVEKEGELKEELSSCQHFLMDTEMKNGKHKIYNFQMSILKT